MPPALLVAKIREAPRLSAHAATHLILIAKMTDELIFTRAETRARVEIVVPPEADLEAKLQKGPVNDVVL